MSLYQDWYHVTLVTYHAYYHVVYNFIYSLSVAPISTFRQLTLAQVHLNYTCWFVLYYKCSITNNSRSYYMNQKNYCFIRIHFKCLLVLRSSHLNAFNTILYLNRCYRYQTLSYSFKSNVECNRQRRRFFLLFFYRSTCVGSAWSFGFSIPATTANVLRLQRISIPDLIHYFIFLS